jgi:hypothetical protein
VRYSKEMFLAGRGQLCKAARFHRKVLEATRFGIRCSMFHTKLGEGKDQQYALLLAAALVAYTAMTPQIDCRAPLAPSDSKTAKCDGSTSVISPSSEAKTLGKSKSIRPNDKPRNVMLHRLRSVKARSLQDKYDINWDVVLGEGAYGAVYPGKLRSTGEKASEEARCNAPLYTWSFSW